MVWTVPYVYTSMLARAAAAASKAASAAVWDVAALPAMLGVHASSGLPSPSKRLAVKGRPGKGALQKMGSPFSSMSVSSSGSSAPKNTGLPHRHKSSGYCAQHRKLWYSCLNTDRMVMIVFPTYVARDKEVLTNASAEGHALELPVASRKVQKACKVPIGVLAVFVISKTLCNVANNAIFVHTCG